MIRAGARARAHTQGGGERRDKVGEGHRHRETHKGERRKEVVEGNKWLWNTFFLIWKWKAKKLWRRLYFQRFWPGFHEHCWFKIHRIMRQLFRSAILPDKCYSEKNIEVLRMLFDIFECLWHYYSTSTLLSPQVDEPPGTLVVYTVWIWLKKDVYCCIYIKKFNIGL